MEWQQCGEKIKDEKKIEFNDIFLALQIRSFRDSKNFASSTRFSPGEKKLTRAYKDFTTFSFHAELCTEIYAQKNAYAIALQRWIYAAQAYMLR